MESQRDAELPDPNTRRWTVRRKAAVVQAVRSGLLTVEQTAERYRLSPEELRAWERGFDRRGLKGLRATQLYREKKISNRR